MDLRLLHTFRMVVESAGITRAAERLHLSQSAVSAHIQQLEQRLGVSLFDRTSKGVRLTQPGEVLNGYSMRILSLVQETEEHLTSLRETRGNRVRLGATDGISSLYLPHTLQMFRREHPGAEILVREGKTTDLLQQVQQDELDFALIPTILASEAYEVTPLVDLELVVICARAHALASQSWVTLEDLVHHPLVLYETGCAYRHTIEMACVSLGQVPQVVMESSGLDSIRRAVESGIGVSVLPAASLTDLRPGAFCVKPLRGVDVRLPVAMVNRKGRYLSAAARAMMEIIRCHKPA